MYVVYINLLYFCRFFCLLTIKIFFPKKQSTTHRMTPQGFESNFRSMRDIHTSIVSQHLAARDNNKYCSHTHCKSPSLMRTYPGTRVVP